MIKNSRSAQEGEFSLLHDFWGLGEGMTAKVRDLLRAPSGVWGLAVAAGKPPTAGSWELGCLGNWHHAVWWSHGSRTASEKPGILHRDSGQVSRDRTSSGTCITFSHQVLQAMHIASNALSPLNTRHSGWLIFKKRKSGLHFFMNGGSKSLWNVFELSYIARREFIYNYQKKKKKEQRHEMFFQFL